MAQAPKTQTVFHPIRGGWATDFSGIVTTSLNQTGEIPVPYLRQARNVEYTLDGSVTGIGGTSSYIPNNGQVVTGFDTPLTGLFDWRHTSGETTQQKVLALAVTPGTHAELYHDSNSTGQFTTLLYDPDELIVDAFQTLNPTTVPHFTTFDDVLVFSTYGDSLSPHLISWDSANGVYINRNRTNDFASFEIPTLGFTAVHKNRLWGAGNVANPSWLYYSANLNILDWSGADAGVIEIAPGDGDEITGIVSWNNELIIFKGPRYGKIYRLRGSAPTGSDAFTLQLLSDNGITAAWQNTIFQFGNDIGFVSPWGSVHSLVTTERYGDLSSTYLSLPITNYLKRSLDLGSRRHWQAVNNPTTSQVWITLRRGGSFDNDLLLIMDYRFMSLGESSPRWSYCDFIHAQSLALLQEYGSTTRVIAGDREGRIWKLGYLTGEHNGTAVTASVETPHLSYGSLLDTKTLDVVAPVIEPRNTQPVTVKWVRDAANTQTATVIQGATSGLGTFQLNHTVLGTTPATPRFVATEQGGEFRTVRYTQESRAVGGQFKTHGIAVQLTLNGQSLENDHGDQ